MDQPALPQTLLDFKVLQDPLLILEDFRAQLVPGHNLTASKDHQDHQLNLAVCKDHQDHLLNSEALKDHLDHLHLAVITDQ